MIDPHVHLRDWEESRKETVKHGLEVAYRAGLDGVFEMPNTSPPLTSRDSILRRIEFADKAISRLGIKIFHGLYAGLTSDPKQIEEVVGAYNKLFPRVVGLKMFACHSTGNMGIVSEKEQRRVYMTLARLDFRGVLAVHCEKESEMKHGLWVPFNPYSHTLARPPESEVASGADQVLFAHLAKYKGILHICHASVPGGLAGIEQVKELIDFKVTYGLTPQHCVMHDEMMSLEDGLLRKTSPPLRPKEMQEGMLDALIGGIISWIETDHAPHRVEDKTNDPYASGIPVLPYYPHFVKFLRGKVSAEMLDKLTHDNIVNTFGIKIKNSKRKPDYNLSKEYEFNPFKIIKE